MNMRNISVLRFKSSIFQDNEYISVCHNIINTITAPYDANGSQTRKTVMGSPLIRNFLFSVLNLIFSMSQIILLQSMNRSLMAMLSILQMFSAY